MFYMCTFFKYLECGITFRFTGCLEAPVVWSTVGDFPWSTYKKGRQHYHHERKHKNEKIHKKKSTLCYTIYMFTTLKYLKWRITFMFSCCPDAVVGWSIAGWLPLSTLCMENRQDYINELNILMEIHNNRSVCPS